MADLLVVEDDATIGRALRTSLIANGHAVTWVQSGADAVSAVEGGSFGLVLLDLGLPDMDGLERVPATSRRPTGVHDRHPHRSGRGDRRRGRVGVRRRRLPHQAVSAR